jgi:hypothetical protein
MSIDRDIEKMARHLIQKHGAKAQGVARSRIAELGACPSIRNLLDGDWRS